MAKSLSEFVNEIEKRSNAAKGELSYRGHPNCNYKMVPSIFRKDAIRGNEKNIIYSAIAENAASFESDRYFFDKLVRAQHYGFSTRLLDLTKNPLIALFFACEKEPDSDADVVIVEVPSSGVKFFLSDEVSCKANIAQLTPKEARDLYLVAGIAISDGLRRLKAEASDVAKVRVLGQWDSVVDAFNEVSVTKRLVQFIREEKPYFQAKIDPLDLLGAVVTYPKKTNARIAAQAGMFLTFGLNEEVSNFPLTEIRPRYDHIRVPASVKPSMLKSLAAVGIDESVIYPELDRSAKMIMEKFAC